jgi:pimeloyl-ACP methyl ester carboxylesterase
MGFFPLPQAAHMRSTKPHRYWLKLVRFALIALLGEGLLTAYGILPLIYAHRILHPARSGLCCQTPADYGLHYEPVQFNTSDNISLQGWYIPSQNNAIIILAHGWGSNRISMLPYAQALARHGYGALLLDLRAFGESGGTQITFTGEDVLAAARYLDQRPDIQGTKIGVLGLSLGGLAANQAAAFYEQSLIRAIVVDGAGLADFRDQPAPTSFAHLLDLPFQWVASQYWRLAGAAPIIPAVEALPKIAPRPILLIAGASSPLELGAMRKFYAAASRPQIANVSLWEVPDAGHIEAFAKYPEEYEQTVSAFFSQLK